MNPSISITPKSIACIAILLLLLLFSVLNTRCYSSIQQTNNQMELGKNFEESEFFFLFLIQLNGIFIYTSLSGFYYYNDNAMLLDRRQKKKNTMLKGIVKKKNEIEHVFIMYSRI